MEISTGTVIGGYVVREQLGAGGMGSVYLVRHPTLPRDVALKVLHAGLSATPAMRARFEREAELLSRLSHPNVVDVLDRGQQGDLLWMAMQYVPGPDLATLLERSGALPPERALDIVAAIGNALDHAHACGLLHRDVKPANILLATMPGGGERVMLTDFGIGRDMTASSALTRAGEVVASFAYASPEQVSGAAVDARADVYSLGAVLFELLTGRRAFDADSLPALLYAVVHAPPPDVRAVRPDLPPAISGVLARALAKDPADRFGSCAELVAAARACWPARVPAPETAVGPVPVPPPPQRPAAPTRSRRGPLLAAGAALLVIAVGVALLVVAPWRGEADDPVSSPSASGTTSQARSGGLQEWGEAQFVVDDFPSLLPASPADEGWGGGSCAPTAFADDVHADVGVTCSYDNGITAEVAHYPDIAARDARRAELEQGDAADSPQSWGIDGARAGLRLLSEEDPEFIWQWIMFNQPDKALYVVVLEWAEHTHAELDDAWFSSAPFTGPAGT